MSNIPHVLPLHADRKCRDITGWPRTDWGPDSELQCFTGYCRHAKSTEKINLSWSHLISFGLD